MRTEEIIRRPLITEKSTGQRETDNVLAFEVHRDANKIEVRRAVEQRFGVKVAHVRVVSMHGKERRRARLVGRRPDWKKAYVRLAPGETAPEFFEGA